jgi:hypothetical protein
VAVRNADAHSQWRSATSAARIFSRDRVLLARTVLVACRIQRPGTGSPVHDGYSWIVAGGVFS